MISDLKHKSCIDCDEELVFEGSGEYEPDPITGEPRCFSCDLKANSERYEQESEVFFMVKLKQIKKIGLPPDWQWTMPNGDVIDIRVERRGANYRRYHIILPQPHGKMVFEKMSELRDFLNQNFEG